MGGYSASSHDVTFEFDLALQTARQLYELSTEVEGKQSSWATEAAKAQDGWVGGHRDTFDANLTTAGLDASEVKGALRSLANLFATRWAEARGEQNRINWARWVQAEKDDDNWAEDGVEWIAGEDDYGEPPGNPAPPQPPGYAETHLPGLPVVIKPEFADRHG
ncbi:MAG TPA: hypothetical protein VFI47_10395 [Acidimicrobiales bacterium]|nr:hypothetical protein [Acidimicrobiales bacterium]